MNTVVYARQGDVGFLQASIPSKATRIKVRPFAFGEVTGHSHRVAVEDEAAIEMFEMGDDTFLKVKDDCLSIIGRPHVRVLHEDHDPNGKTSLLPAGWEGIVRVAVEYDEEGDFRVAD